MSLCTQSVKWEGASAVKNFVLWKTFFKMIAINIPKKSLHKIFTFLTKTIHDGPGKR